MFASWVWHLLSCFIQEIHMFFKSPKWMATGQHDKLLAQSDTYAMLGVPRCDPSFHPRNTWKKLRRKQLLWLLGFSLSGMKQGKKHDNKKGLGILAVLSIIPYPQYQPPHKPWFRCGFAHTVFDKYPQAVDRAGVHETWWNRRDVSLIGVNQSGTISLRSSNPY